MTASFDAVATASVANGVSNTLSWTHTPVGTPTSVGVFLHNYTGGSNVTGVTYGGNALTFNTASANIGVTDRVEIWGSDGITLPAGAQTVTITFNASLNIYCNAASISVTGSDPVTCFSNSNTATGNSTAPSVVVTSAVGELVCDIACNDVTDSTLTQSGGQTLRWGVISAPSLEAAGSSKAGAASVTMSWTCASEPWAIAAASFKAGASGGTPAQVGMPAGFLFRPGSGPTWEQRRRQAFPPQSLSISLSGISNVAIFGRAAPSGKLPMLGRGTAAAMAKAQAAGKVPLLAKSSAQSSGVTGSTNFIRNNTMQGAVVGVVGSGGALPTNWGISGSASMTLNVVAFTSSSIDIQFTGSPTNGQFSTFSSDSGTTAPAAIGQTWTASTLAALVGGSNANISNFSIILQENNGSGVNVAQHAVALLGSLTAALARFSSTFTFSNVATQFAILNYGLNYSGGAVNITIRFALPQLEMNANATPVIQTSGAIRGVPMLLSLATSAATYLKSFARTGQTNYIRNSTMQGASAGTPGTLPTNWVDNSIYPQNGISRSIAVSSEGNQSTIDVTYTGTCTSTFALNVMLDGNTPSSSAAVGQTWVAAVFTRLLSGSYANLSGAGVKIYCGEFSGSTLNAATSATCNNATDLASSRTSVNRTFTFSSSNLAGALFQFGFVSGQTYTFTTRIGVATLEQTANTTAPVLTTSGTANTIPAVLMLATSGLASIKSNAKAAASGVVSLAGKSAAMTRALAGIGTGGLVALLARASAMAKAVGSPAGKVPVSARATTQAKVQDAPSGKVPLAAKVAAQTSLRSTLGAIVGLQAMTALSGIAVKARAGLAGVVGLSGASKLQAKAPSALAGSVGLAGRTATAVRTKAGAVYRLALAAAAKVSSRASLGASVGALAMSARASIMAAALGGVSFIGFVLLPVKERTVVVAARIRTLIAKW